MFTGTKIAIAAAIIFAAAPAMASDHEDQSGGFMVDASSVGGYSPNHQVLVIGSDGHVTTGGMPTDSKMLKMMHGHGHVMGRSLMLWRDDKGIHACSGCGT